MSLPKSQSELDSSVPACITDKTVWLYLEVDNDLYTINQAGFVFGLTIKGTVRRKRFGEHPGPLCRKRRPGCRDVNASRITNFDRRQPKRGLEVMVDSSLTTSANVDDEFMSRNRTTALNHNTIKRWNVVKSGT
ncbi:hypothetical protein CIB48_g5717 [Xylaria polymorpha]|nr:hypothetical protein CIB48_g5717 [Xylaria polymorpha]